jgi:hypothetical protein
MIADLNALAAVLEKEVAVGEELLQNLARQRRALVEWDMEALIAGIDAREICLRSLGELEDRRLQMLTRAGIADTSVTLRDLISQMAVTAPERERFQSVRARAREVYSHLQAEERSVAGLMQDLAAHLRSALTAVARPAAPLYAGTGAAAPQPPASAFLRNRV